MYETTNYWKKNDFLLSKLWNFNIGLVLRINFVFLSYITIFLISATIKRNIYKSIWISKSILLYHKIKVFSTAINNNIISTLMLLHCIDCHLKKKNVSNILNWYYTHERIDFLWIKYLKVEIKVVYLKGEKFGIQIFALIR